MRKNRRQAYEAGFIIDGRRLDGGNLVPGEEKA
jgi:hypothetical protein